MGINYSQHCILGICIDADDILQVISPAIVKEEPRYDTKTGEQTHTVTVQVKQEVSVYSFDGVQDEYLWDFGEALAEKYECDFFCDEENQLLYLGVEVAESNDCGRADLLEDEISLSDLLDLTLTLKDTFTGKDINLYFMYSIG